MANYIFMVLALTVTESDLCYDVLVYLGRWQKLLGILSWENSQF